MPNTPLSTPFRDAGEGFRRYPFSPDLNTPASGATKQIQYYRAQDAGQGFTVAVKNRSRIPFGFSIQDSNDGGSSDAYAAVNMRLGTTTVTSVTLQPGGFAEVSIDGASTGKQFIALFTDTPLAVGTFDIFYSQGSFDRDGSPPVSPVVYAAYLDLDSGVTALATGADTIVLEFHTPNGPTSPHRAGITGEVATQALSSLILEKQASPSGPWVVVKTDAGFNTVDDNIEYATNNAYTTAAGSAFQMTVNLEGYTGFRLKARTAVTGGTLRLRGIAS